MLILVETLARGTAPIFFKNHHSDPFKLYFSNRCKYSQQVLLQFTTSIYLLLISSFGGGDVGQCRTNYDQQDFARRTLNHKQLVVIPNLSRFFCVFSSISCNKLKSIRKWLIQFCLNLYIHTKNFSNRIDKRSRNQEGVKKFIYCVKEIKREPSLQLVSV